jgi:hypothetical protein
MIIIAYIILWFIVGFVSAVSVRFIDAAPLPGSIWITIILIGPFGLPVYGFTLLLEKLDKWEL